MPDQEKKPILDPERELPEPHDMSLEAGYGAELPAGTTSGKNRSFPMWLFPLLALLIVLLAGGMYLLNMQKETTKADPPIQPTPTVSPTPDPVIGWKLFTSASQDFSFKYPSALSGYLQESKKGVVISYPGASDMNLFAVDVYQTDLSPEAWWEKQGKKNYSWLYNTAVNSVALSGSNRDDELKGIEIIGQRKTEGGATLSASLKIFPHNHSLYVITNNTDHYTNDIQATLILSTFRFITATPVFSPAASGSGTMCTMDAKLCPDGSSVGRTGPNCEFAACPKK